MWSLLLTASTEFPCPPRLVFSHENHGCVDADPSDTYGFTLLSPAWLAAQCLMTTDGLARCHVLWGLSRHLVGLQMPGAAGFEFNFLGCFCYGPWGNARVVAICSEHIPTWDFELMVGELAMAVQQ